MMVMATRFFTPYDSMYADKCLKAAILSYNCLKEHPGLVEPDLTDFKTGGYTSTDEDDRIWAAAETWETTGDTAYLTDFENSVKPLALKIDEDWD